MPPIIATVIFSVGICGLFWLIRDRNARVSAALILPAIWLVTMSSRSVTEWVAILTTGRPPVGISQAEAYAEGTPLDRNVFIVVMILTLAVVVHRARIVSLLRANLPMIVFFLYAAASVFWSDFPDITIRRWSKAVGILLAAFVVLSERNRDVAVKRLLTWVGFILIPVSMLWIKYYPVLGRTFRAQTSAVWITEMTGVTRQKNGLGEICLIFGITFLSCFLAAYRDRKHPYRTRLLLAYGMALGILVWVFLQSQSRTSQTAFVLAAIILIVARRRAVVRRRGLVHLLMLILAGAPFAVLFLGVGSRLITALGKSETLTGRTDIWSNVIPLVHNPVLGTGFESFWVGQRLEIMQQGLSFPLQEAHNGFLEVYITLGWIGVLLLLLLLITGYRNIIACYRRDPAAGSFRLGLFLSVIVPAATEATFRSIALSWFVFMLVTMLTPQEWRSATTSKPVLTKDHFEAVEADATRFSFQ